MKYLEEQEEERKYRQNTGMLDSYANELVELLARNKLKTLIYGFTKLLPL